MSTNNALTSAAMNRIRLTFKLAVESRITNLTDLSKRLGWSVESISYFLHGATFQCSTGIITKVHNELLAELKTVAPPEPDVGTNTVQRLVANIKQKLQFAENLYTPMWIVEQGKHANAAVTYLIKPSSYLITITLDGFKITVKHKNETTVSVKEIK